MIKNDPIINKIAHGDAIEDLAKQRNISISEAKEEFTRMSFLEYHRLISEAGANITPPSGNTISPSGSTGTVQKPAQAAAGPQQMKAIWPGNGAPVEMGMTVGMKGANGLPVPGTVSQVDKGANGVKVKNSTTGADEWVNMDALEPFMAQGNQAAPVTPGADIQRLRELAGLPESCSGGASGAGGIAVASKPMGGVQRRQPAEEALKKEYTPKVAKTVVGDTKPAQASGQLSSTLAANGSKTASRINNGFKR